MNDYGFGESKLTFVELLGMIFEPIKRAIKQWFYRRELRSLDRHIDVLRSGIRNDQRALSELEKDRALLSRRLF